MSSRPGVRAVPLLLVALLALLLAACGDDSDEGSASPSSPTAEDTTTTEAPASTTVAAEAEAPREVVHHLGTTEVPARVERVVSASVTMTGHLLAIDAPVVASMTTRPSDLADTDGFFVQWGDVAREKQVEPIPGPEINIEAIAGADPDLIVGSAVGGDAVTEEVYEQLSQVAPTIVLDHSSVSWQELTTTLGKALGLEDEAARAIAGFEELVAEVSAGLPGDHEVVAMTVTPEGLNVFTPESAHGQLLTTLGFAYHEIEEGLSAAPELQGGGGRTDVVAVSQENAEPAFGDSTLFFVYADEASVAQIESTMPVLANLPAFTEGRAHALGFESFRLDRFSATSVVERIGSLGG